MKLNIINIEFPLKMHIKLNFDNIEFYTKLDFIKIKFYKRETFHGIVYN